MGMVSKGTSMSFRALYANCLCGLGLLLGVAAGAAVITEDFSASPAQRGWIAAGDASLFRWDAEAGVLQATWDSSRTNSFLRLPLGTILSQADDFSFSFELRLQDIRVGTTPGKSNEFEIAIGLLHSTSAAATNAFRGAGQSSQYGMRNLVEWDFFPDAGFGDTWATTVVSTNNRIFPAHNFPVPLEPGHTFRVTLGYTATNQLLRTMATRDGAPYGLPPAQTLAELRLAGLPDFRVDSFAVISYSDAVQTGPPAVHGSVLAHGSVDNIELHLPPLPVADLHLRRSSGVWQAEFRGARGWNYQLERSPDFRQWAAVSVRAMTEQPAVAMTLSDTNEPFTGAAYYRVRAEKP
jgi:hypothetical protein